VRLLRNCVFLAALALGGCATATPALIGAGLGLGAAALNLDTTILQWYLCQRGQTIGCTQTKAHP
jgi:hypothetical protein